MDDIRHSISRRQRVLVFTDLVDSVAWKARVGNDAYVDEIQVPHDRLLEAILRETPGTDRLNDTGDGFLLGFATSSGAVTACLRFQHELRTRAWRHGPIQVRIGIHLGEVNEWGLEPGAAPKITGIATDMAARVMGLGLPGQILLTRTVFDDARMFVREHPAGGGDRAAARGDGVAAGGIDATARSDAPPLEWLAHGQYLFKGSDEPVEIFEVGASGFAPLRPPPDGEKARRNVAVGQELTLGWRPARGLPVPGRENWDLAEKLGEGGFGEVWLGLHRKTREKRVFKFCLHPDRLRGLKREAALFRLLKETFGERDDFARISDWQFERAPYFLEIEYTPDGSLPDWIDKQGGIDRVPLETRLALVAETADALAAAHRAGVLHRDIKPSNILIRTDRHGQPHAVLSDFGIGLVIDRELLSGKGITTAGFTNAFVTGSESSRTGTRLYAAPELLEGREPTAQSDLYSLGVLLYQLVVGDLRRALAPGWERAVPDELLREDIAACIDGEPERRLAGPELLFERLRSLPARKHAKAAEKTLLERVEKRRSRHNRTLAILIPIAILGLALASRMITDSKEETRRLQAELNLLQTDRGPIGTPGIGRSAIKESNPNQIHKRQSDEPDSRSKESHAADFADPAKPRSADIRSSQSNAPSTIAATSTANAIDIATTKLAKGISVVLAESNQESVELELFLGPESESDEGVATQIAQALDEKLNSVGILTGQAERRLRGNFSIFRGSIGGIEVGVFRLNAALETAEGKTEVEMKVSCPFLPEPESKPFGSEATLNEK